MVVIIEPVIIGRYRTIRMDVDVLLKIVAAIGALLTPIVVVLWRALNTAWVKIHDNQAVYIAKVEAQQERCRLCAEKGQEQYKELIMANVKVIEQNTEAQNTQQHFAELLKKLDEVKAKNIKSQ